MKENNPIYMGDLVVHAPLRGSEHVTPIKATSVYLSGGKINIEDKSDPETACITHIPYSELADGIDKIEVDAMIAGKVINTIKLDLYKRSLY